MFFHNFETLRQLHVEITTGCNAACPMCARNNYGGKTVSSLKLNQWTAEEGGRVFSDRFANLSDVLFCGTHGDPAMAKDCLQIVEAAKKTSAFIEFYSNGSVRNKDWWVSLAQILKESSMQKSNDNQGLAVFSVDGLEDTNHLYRRRTQFGKIMENAEAYLNAGGRARWDFIVFKHNEHQVEEAQVLAKKMGFAQFRVRKTSRFAYSPDGPDKHRVLDQDGTVEYYLEPPTNPSYLNETKKQFEDAVKKERNPNVKLDQKIRCLNKSTFQRLYVSAQLEVFPCCFISSDNQAPNGRLFDDTKEKIFNNYEPGFNSLKQKEWEGILEHPFFKKDIVQSWESSQKKLVRCQRTCSVKFNPITSQSENKNL